MILLKMLWTITGDIRRCQMKGIKPKEVNNKLYYFIVLIIITLNYIRQDIFGYRKPRSFFLHELEHYNVTCS